VRSRLLEQKQKKDEAEKTRRNKRRTLASQRQLDSGDKHRLLVKLVVIGNLLFSADA